MGDIISFTDWQLKGLPKKSFNKEEWWEIMRHIKGIQYTRAEYDTDWERIVAAPVATEKGNVK